MLRASAGDAAGKDLRTLGDILPETGGVLVVDILRLLHAEHADLFLSAVRAERSALRIVSVHLEQPFRLTISIPFRCEPVRIGGKGRRQKGSDSSFGISSNPELPLFEYAGVPYASPEAAPPAGAPGAPSALFSTKDNSSATTSVA